MTQNEDPKFEGIKTLTIFPDFFAPAQNEDPEFEGIKTARCLPPPRSR